jgi:SRSO17 transposase
MTEEQIADLGPALTKYLGCYRQCFARQPTFKHLGTYCRGLLSDLARKSVEPIALAAGTAVRTLQEFLTHHAWDQDGLLGRLQRRIVAEHLPAPGQAADSQHDPDGLGVIGVIDETSVPKKGDKTPGVQRQYCGAHGKVENCIVTVHLVVKYGRWFLAMLDSDLFLPEESWDLDRARCQEAHIPQDITYRSKWLIALEQLKRAVANGVRFDWLTFDEWYGGKPEFLFLLEEMGMNYVCEVPANFMCWPSLPKYHSLQTPFATKRVDSAVVRGRPFRQQTWRSVRLTRQTLAPQTWQVKAAQVWLQRDGRPTDRSYWLIVARNAQTGETKYFVSNAPPKTALLKLLKVAFCRWNVEHAFRLVKTEIGFGHFEGRCWRGLLRHMILCQVVMLFVAEQTTRLRGEKSGPDDGADGAGLEPGLPALAAPSPNDPGHRARRRCYSVPSGPQPRRSGIATTISSKAVVAL